MTDFRGFPCCTCLKKWLPVYESELLRVGAIQHNIDVYQLIGGAAASGGTHSKGGAFDIGQTSLEAIKVARQMGADATWHRPYNWDNRGGMEHTHGVLTGCPHNGPARYQIDDVRNGLNGLANHAKDTGPRPLSGRTWEQGIAWAKAQVPPKPLPFSIRAGVYNIPDETKIPNAVARIKAGAELIDAGKLDVLGINEGVGRRGKGVASKHAIAIRDAVIHATGMKWTLIVPTTDLNENYILIKDATVSLASQWADTIIRVNGVPGRHVTRAVLRHKATKRKFVFGVTHLVNDNRPGTQKQAPVVAASLLRMAKSHDCPIVLVGDMNNSDDLTALTKAGIVDTRSRAKAKTNDNFATFTTYAATKPSTRTKTTTVKGETKLGWRIDQCRVRGGESSDVTVTGQTLILGAPGGTFDQPRPSDHGVLVTALRFS